MLQRPEITVALPEHMPSNLRQSHDLRRQQRAREDVERGDDLETIVRNLDQRLGRQYFLSTYRAVGGHLDHRLALRVEAEPPEAKDVGFLMRVTWHGR